MKSLSNTYSKSGAEVRGSWEYNIVPQQLAAGAMRARLYLKPYSMSTVESTFYLVQREFFPVFLFF